MKAVQIATLVLLGLNLATLLYREFQPKQPIIIQNHIPACGSLGKSV